NTIGAAVAGVSNVISGNAIGVQIDSAGTNGNVVIGNFIGPDVTGTAPVQVFGIPQGNYNGGLEILAGAQNNRIGTDGDGVNDTLERNIISGNGNTGLDIEGVGTKFNV